jgi:hypothetical protein
VTSDEIVNGVGDWLTDLHPELMRYYAFSPTSKGDLPDVVIEIEGAGVRFGDETFPIRAIQQALIERWDLTASFMVLNEDPEGAASLLRTFADRCVTDVLSDSTLRGRVPFVSPFVTFDYTPPFVEYADGTRGREMSMTLSVGQLVEVDQ